MITRNSEPRWLKGGLVGGMFFRKGGLVGGMFFIKGGLVGKARRNYEKI